MKVVHIVPGSGGTFYGRNSLRTAAAECVAACPTGTLAFMKGDESRKPGHGDEPGDEVV